MAVYKYDGSVESYCNKKTIIVDVLCCSVKEIINQMSIFCLLCNDFFLVIVFVFDC